MQRLAGAQEHLDGPLEPVTLAGNLRDLARINHRFGGVAISRAAIADLAARVPERPIRILDVGTGAADIPRALLRDWTTRPAISQIVAVDTRPEIIGLARRGQPSDRLRIELVEGTRLPYPDGSFDVAHASLVLHHLEPVAAVAMLREMARVATLGVVVNDLDRSRRGWVGAWLVVRLMTSNRYTLHDGPMSVARSWRPAELVQMAHQADLHGVGRHRAFLRHRYAIAFRQHPG